MDKISMHCYVSGQVQGVFYRASTRDKAVSLGVVGWVKNLSDGRVEVLASGEAEKVNTLVSWLNEGPDAASVSKVETKAKPWQEFSSFDII